MRLCPAEYAVQDRSQNHANNKKRHRIANCVLRDVLAISAAFVGRAPANQRAHNTRYDNNHETFARSIL